MLTTVRRAWSRALRSGEFPQTHDGFMRVYDSYCPLGVLCELQARETGYLPEYTFLKGIYAYHGQISTLPLQVQVWARLYEDNPRVKYDDGFGQVYDIPLAVLNDKGAGPRGPLTFPELARLIDEQW